MRLGWVVGGGGEGGGTAGFWVAFHTGNFVQLCSHYAPDSFGDDTGQRILCSDWLPNRQNADISGQLFLAATSSPGRFSPPHLQSQGKAPWERG